MANTDTQFLDEVVQAIKGPSERLLDETIKSNKQRVLSDRLSAKADRLLIRETIASRKNNKKPGGVTGRLAKRAGGAALGGIGSAIGGIPIVGAIFRAIGQEAAATLKDKKNFNKELVKQRKAEHKLLEQAQAEKEKQAQAELDAANPTGKRRSNGSTGAGGNKLSVAAEKLEAAAISLQPSIQTFEEVVVKLDAVADKMSAGGTQASRITDPQVIEYLHAIEFYSQETAANIEKLGVNASKFGGVGGGRINVGPKALEYLHAIEFMSQETAAKVETISANMDPMTKDIEAIRLSSYRTNMSSIRIERLLLTAAKDRLNELETQQEQLKVQKKQFESQEDTKLIGILGLISNFMGSGLKALGGLLSGAGALAGPVLAVGAAAAIGVAIGDELNKYLQGNQVFENFMTRVFDVFDNILAKFGDKDAQGRVKARDDMAYVQYARDLAKQAGQPELDAKTEDYVMKNHTLPGMDPKVFENRGYVGGAFGIDAGRKSPEEMNKIMANWRMDQATPMEPGADLLPKSAELEQARSELEAKRALRQQAISQNSQVNNNNQTVIPAPLSADPGSGVQKSRNLGD
ncbi:hypothetical protein [Pseudomonas phage Astolliot]|nr:hypothetical protein [Pseudomonas phage Astolliot]